MSEFYVWLHSNASSALFPDNKISDFRVQLPNPIELDRDLYKVGLTECSYTQTNRIFNDDIKSPHRLILYRIWKRDAKGSRTDETVHEYYIRGQPDSIHDLVTILNTEFSQNVLKTNHGKQIQFHINDKECVVDLRSLNFEVKLSEKILAILGFDPVVVFNKQTQTSKYVPDFSAGQHLLLIYSDVCNNSVVSDSSAPLLRSIVNDTTIANNKRVLHTFVSPYFIKPRSSYITSIHVTILNESGEPFNFDKGVFSLVLCFKPRI